MRQKLIKKIDRIFSEYIRLKHADKKGYCNCITCGKTYHYKNIDAGHFVSRRFLIVRFDELNVHPQCKYCNRFLNGLAYEYGKAIDMLYGKGTADKLVSLSRQTIKIQNYELEEKHLFYKKNLITLRKQL
jgi:hypothetical protein